MASQVACMDSSTRNQAIGPRLRVLREERGIPREQLALVLGMGSENLRHYESGRQRLTLEMLPAIAALYEMPVETLAVRLLSNADDLAEPTLAAVS